MMSSVLNVLIKIITEKVVLTQKEDEGGVSQVVHVHTGLNGGQMKQH